MAEEFVALTRKWAESSDGKLDAERDLLAKRLRAHYFVLDPYIRGRGCTCRASYLKGRAS